MTGRSSGILLSISSLPGPYGIGSMGAEARSFVDFLASAGQHYWQILPLVPPGGGNSPYMSPSTYAGSPYFIDLDTLAQDGLLTQKELLSARVDDLDRIDYAQLYATRLPLLRRAFGRVTDFTPADWPWLEDYARFSALHDELELPLSQWPKNPGEPEKENVAFHKWLQTVFFQQWTALRAYANSKGVRIIGDLPFYVSADSAEVWSQPELFQLSDGWKAAASAGVPPDAFTDDGQFWGNPLYDWKGHKEQVFDWWVRRMTWAASLYDVVRIDHFRAFHTYWSIPAGAATAREGHWEKGPGKALLTRFEKEVPSLSIIAEDLGDLDEAALNFIHKSGLPGMRVLIYAFDPDGDSSFLPHNGDRDAVMYTGTHDTPTFVQWLFSEAGDRERVFASDYLRLRADEGFGWGAICGAWSSPCALAIAPFQDVLGLGADARMNLPGSMGPHNWSWRVRAEAESPAVAAQLRKITHTYRRC